jgi:hypothetical protein
MTTLAMQQDVTVSSEAVVNTAAALLEAEELVLVFNGHCDTPLAEFFRTTAYEFLGQATGIPEGYDEAFWTHPLVVESYARSKESIAERLAGLDRAVPDDAKVIRERQSVYALEEA